MSLTIPTQAIKFIESDELSFNESDICGCETNEKWSYTFTSGDNICFQVISNCELGEELLLNGSFEDGESSTVIDNWTRDVENVEATNVTRELSGDAQCGEYLIQFTKGAADEPDLASLTQTIAETLEQGKTYKLTIKVKAELGTPTFGVASVLEIIIGGQSYYITPTESWVEYTILATFSDAPSDNLIVIKLNEANVVDLFALYVDCAEMALFGECCLTPHSNNGGFELGQPLDGEIVASADNWAYTDVIITDTGGRNGTRGAILSGVGSEITQSDVFINGTINVVTFWAKYNTNPATLDVIAQPSGTTIDSIALTNEFTKYSYSYTNSTDNDIQFIQVSTDDPITIDDVSVISLPELSIYIKNLENDELQAVSLDVVEVFEGGFNVCIPVDDYIMPECFRICLETCVINLFLNGDFEQGSGNLFTSWTLTQPSRTNLALRSQEFDNATWALQSGGTGSAPVVTANNVVAPDGTMTADRIVFNSGAGVTTSDLSLINQTIAHSAGNPYSGAIYLRGNVGGEQIVFRHAGNGTYTLLTLTTSWVRYRQIETALGANAVFSFGIRQGSVGTINSTATVYAWGAQFETGAFTTPYIPTTTASVTTSLGEFLQDATGGINGGRCLKMWASTGSTSLQQSVSLVNGVNYTIRFWAKVDALYGNDYLTSADATLLVSTEWTLYEQTFTQIGSGSFAQIFDYTNDANFGFVYLDEISITPTEEIVSTCSEDMTYTEQLDPCIKELVWYDESESTDVMGIDYTTGFKNRLRVNAIFLNPQYLKEEFTKTLNGDVSSINSIKVKKTLDFSADALPEFIWDRLAGMLGVSNIEYNGKEYASVTESEVSLTGDKSSRLYSGTITLSPKGEYVAQRSYNC